jgi:hypothetical protein
MFRTHHFIPGLLLLAASCSAGGEASSAIADSQVTENSVRATTRADDGQPEAVAADRTESSPTVEEGADRPAAPAQLKLVVLGDSFAGWSEWPEMYADLMSAALGVDVIADKTVTGTGGPRLGFLEQYDWARDTVRTADVVVVQPQAGFAARPMFEEFLTGECDSGHEDCFAPHIAAYRSYVEEYFDLLHELVSDTAMVRIVSAASWAPDGFYTSQIENDPGLRAILIGGVVAMMDEARAAAEEHGLVFVDVNAAFNGPDYLDVAPDEYLKADGLHLSEAGSLVVAELLHDAGYEPTLVNS